MKLGDLTLREIKKDCKQDNYKCNICDYCKWKHICYSEVWTLLRDLDQEIEVKENENNQ